jgi:hypothetical protein
MPNASKHPQRTVIAPQPSPASVSPLPNRILAVVLEADEDVEWTWTSTAHGVSYVSGYTIVRRGNDSSR